MSFPWISSRVAVKTKYQLPKSLSTSASPSPRPSRLRKYARRTLYTAAFGGAVYTIDKTVNASSLTRTLRTLYTCAMITIDYKLNFTPEKSDLIPELQERVANRMFWLFTSNGGLYIKIGQAMGANAAMLPKAMQRKFASLFDDAPQIPYSSILSVFQSEFNGRSPHDLFAFFDEKAIASASIAQVHRARTHSGEWVAVKIQKPEVNIQTKWDLRTHTLIMWLFERAFGLPVAFASEFVNEHLKRELDFEEEVRNANETREFIESEPRLKGRVHVPVVFEKLSTKKIMTAEWIEGVRMSDREGIRALMGDQNSRTSAAPMIPDSPEELAQSKKSSAPLKKPLKGGVKQIMDSLISLFAAQIFISGAIHCDPHPGNIIVRPDPNDSSRAQVVLLDHGLYMHLSPAFREQYAKLWVALLRGEREPVVEIAEAWGIGAPDLFASSTLMRPTRLLKKNEKMQDNMQSFGKHVGNGQKMTNYEASVIMKEILRRFLTDTDKIPKELFFLGRHTRMVQGNNQALGSPVNRIKVTGLWAARALALPRTNTIGSTPRSIPAKLRNFSLRHYLQACYRDAVFRTALFSLDLVFWTSRIRQWLRVRFGKTSLGFEDELERYARGSIGLEVKGAFDG